MKILEFDKNIYKNLRKIYGNNCSESIAIKANDLIPPDGTNRMFINNWYNFNNYLLYCENIDYNTVKNFFDNKEIFSGIIYELQTPIDQANFLSLSSYCHENNSKQYFIINNEEKQNFYLNLPIENIESIIYPIGEPYEIG